MTRETLKAWPKDLVDEEFKKIRAVYRVRHAGFTPAVSDVEVLTMEICGEYFKQQTDKDLSGSVVQHYRHVFPALAERSVLVRQAANLWQFKAALQRRLTFVSGQAHAPVQPIDTLPLPVCTYTRARRDRCFAGIAAYSYCDVKDLPYYGFKLGLRISRCGMIMHRSVTNYCAHTSPSRQWRTKLVEGRHAGWSALLHTLLQSNLQLVSYDLALY